MDTMMTNALRTALKGNDVFARNWSGGGEYVFAIYTHDDSYVGSILVADRASVRGKNSKREATILARLCADFNAAMSVSKGA